MPENTELTTKQFQAQMLAEQIAALCGSDNLTENDCHDMEQKSYELTFLLQDIKNLMFPLD